MDWFRFSFFSAPDLILLPGVHYTVKPGPITSAPTSSPPLNPTDQVASPAATPPSPEEPDTRNNASTVRAVPRVPPTFPPLRPPTGGLIQPDRVSDPATLSARPGPLNGLMVVGKNYAVKKSPVVNKLAGFIRGIYWLTEGLSSTSSPSQAAQQTVERTEKNVVIDAEKWIKDVRMHRRVVHLEMDGERCGRNYLIRLDDGHEACAKQRRNYDQIQVINDTTHRETSCVALH